jgi:AcrR family transcriptional regulator
MALEKIEGTARERLLAAASELFYEEGVHTVGIDRVIERAGVAKASLYSAFGSKEELVRAYLASRAELRRQRISLRIARFPNPRDRIAAIFDLLTELAAEPKFRGCAFVNASAEGDRAEGKVRSVCTDSRAWVRGLFIDLAGEMGSRDAEMLGRQIAMLYDGAMVTAAMERDLEAPSRAKSAALALLDASAPARPKKKRDKSKK